MDQDLGALLDAVRGLQWPVRRPVHGGIAGTHHSRLRGTAPELAEYRFYRQGDEARRIDWKLLARSDRAYIRLAPDRATLKTAIVLDASASMAFPRPSLDKWRMARQLAIGLAAVAHAGGDPVGLVVSGEQAQRLAPRSRRGVIHAMAALLDRVAPAGSAPLASALASVAGIPRVAVVSDLLGDEDAIIRWARTHAVSGGIPHVVHVVAPDEVAPSSTAITAVDPENTAETRPFDERVRDAYIATFAGWRESVARRAREAGAVYVQISTDEPPARAVGRIVSPAPAAA